MHGATPTEISRSQNESGAVLDSGSRFGLTSLNESLLASRGCLNILDRSGFRVSRRQQIIPQNPPS